MAEPKPKGLSEKELANHNAKPIADAPVVPPAMEETAVINSDVFTSDVFAKIGLDRNFPIKDASPATKAALEGRPVIVRRR